MTDGKPTGDNSEKKVTAGSGRTSVPAGAPRPASAPDSAAERARARRRRQLLKRAAVKAYGIVTENGEAEEEHAGGELSGEKVVREAAESTKTTASTARRTLRRTLWSAPAASASRKIVDRALDAKSATEGGTSAAVSPASRTRELETVLRPAAARREKYRRARLSTARRANLEQVSGRAGARARKAAAATANRAARRARRAAEKGTRRALAAVLAPLLSVGAVVALVVALAIFSPLMVLFGGYSTRSTTGLTGNAATIYLYLSSQGMGDVQIAAILGNMSEESGLDPSAVNPDTGALGLCQWLGGRGRNLKSFAESEGASWDDINLQLKFLYTQDEYPTASWRAAFEAETDVDEATRMWLANYERPGDISPYISARQEKAREYLALIRSGGVTSSIPYYSQFDSRWASHAYGPTTLKVGGCSPTSLAMVVSAATGSSVTPDQVADWAGSTYWVNGSGTANASMYQAAAKKWNLGTVRHTSSISEAVTALRSGHPVISAQSAGFFTKGGHLIVLRGVSGDDILVHDPAHPEYSNRTFTQSEIDAAGKSYYIFEGVTLTSSTGDESASATAKAVVSAAKSTPAAPAHRCASWVSSVYSKAGISISGNAAGSSTSMYARYTYSTDRSAIKPGMVIAANYSPYGHVGIYLGDGKVISSETSDGTGVLVTRTLDNWISTFGTKMGATVRWGYPSGVE